MFLSVILDGYDKVCTASKTLTPLLFELQRGHLQKFSLTWNLLNKRMYQRWVYWGVKELIPECILKVMLLVLCLIFCNNVSHRIQMCLKPSAQDNSRHRKIQGNGLSFHQIRRWNVSANVQMAWNMVTGKHLPYGKSGYWEATANVFGAFDFAKH